jgi:putative transposase
MRKTEFANNEYYHIYNQGVDKREVFLCDEDYKRFFVGLREFN